MSDKSNKCGFCDREFYSAFNRRRHEIGAHKNEIEGPEGEDLDHGNELQSLESVERPDSGEDIHSPETQESVSESDEEIKDMKSASEDSAKEDESSDEDDKESEVWERVILEALATVEDPEVDTLKDVFQEPFLGRIIKAIRHVLDDYTSVAEVIENSDVCSKIENTKQHLEEKGYGENEATEAAWEQRKFLVKRLLREHKNTIQDELFPEESEDEAEEMDV